MQDNVRQYTVQELVEERLLRSHSLPAPPHTHTPGHAMAVSSLPDLVSGCAAQHRHGSDHAMPNPGMVDQTMVW